MPRRALINTKAKRCQKSKEQKAKQNCSRSRSPRSQKLPRRRHYPRSCRSRPPGRSSSPLGPPHLQQWALRRLGVLALLRLPSQNLADVDGIVHLERRVGLTALAESRLSRDIILCLDGGPARLGINLPEGIPKPIQRLSSGHLGRLEAHVRHKLQPSLRGLPCLDDLVPLAQDTVPLARQVLNPLLKGGLLLSPECPLLLEALFSSSISLARSSASSVFSFKLARSLRKPAVCRWLITAIRIEC